MIAFNGNIAAEAALRQFRRLASCGCVPEGVSAGHRDGWGIASFGDNGPPVVRKGLLPADADGAYSAAVAEVAVARPSFVMAHLRKASVGEPSLANTHPFTDGRYAFCHNGSIFGNEKIVLAPAFEKKVLGTTDSERFFYSIMEDLGPESGPQDAAAAFAQSAESVRTVCDYFSLTSLLMGATGVRALREVNEENPVVKEKGMLGYYTLFAGSIGGEESVISSEKLDLEGVIWREIPNRTACGIGIAAPLRELPKALEMDMVTES